MLPPVSAFGRMSLILQCHGLRSYQHLVVGLANATVLSQEVHLSRQAHAGIGERTPWEMFYACPSASVVAFLDAAASLAPAAESPPNSAGAMQTLSELAAATQVSCVASLCVWRRLSSAHRTGIP